MEQPLRELAAEAGLAAEPGRYVIELRPAGMDKGQALRSLVDEAGARSVVFTGDDLGDLPAFEEVGRLRSDGLAACWSAPARQRSRRSPSGPTSWWTARKGWLPSSPTWSPRSLPA